ncbi:type II toxin-antitoxin system RelE/ParE family toxin [Pollutimonas bauzanensis]|uniref:Proteic killer suppression protein n=1 Tax=Pollutimonas bauzanensis TaxID=658167 RepID=A0A1M5Z6K3_9BURK|nr:type II toxin-antitoxin system RelE/ParE family toxin [Pollutimonas bauzanensis]SHI19784.1 proteic killer suppression protein [Pollutimonas bauzanensis]
MIRTFIHKGLEKFHETGSLAGIQPQHARRLRLILALLGQARVIGDVYAPGLRLHPLQGNLKDFWSLTVQANWRIIFRFEDGDVHAVDYVDYH